MNLPTARLRRRSTAKSSIGPKNSQLLIQNGKLKLTWFEDGNLTFSAHSDALISAGLAAILIDFYNGATPEEILSTPPTFLKKLGIISSLSPGRANGLASLYHRIHQTAQLLCN